MNTEAELIYTCHRKHQHAYLIPEGHQSVENEELRFIAQQLLSQMLLDRPAFIVASFLDFVPTLDGHFQVPVTSRLLSWLLQQPTTECAAWVASADAAFVERLVRDRNFWSAGFDIFPSTDSSVQVLEDLLRGRSSWYKKDPFARPVEGIESIPFVCDMHYLVWHHPSRPAAEVDAMLSRCAERIGWQVTEWPYEGDPL